MAEEIIDAFMSIDKRRIDHPDLIYRGGSCTLMQKDDTRACLQLGEFCARTDQNQMENVTRR